MEQWAIGENMVRSCSFLDKFLKLINSIRKLAKVVYGHEFDSPISQYLRKVVPQQKD